MESILSYVNVNFVVNLTLRKGKRKISHKYNVLLPLIYQIFAIMILARRYSPFWNDCNTTVAVVCNSCNRGDTYD